MRPEDYYNEEIAVINRRLSSYFEYGYSLELQPIVDALKECRDKLITAKEAI